MVGKTHSGYAEAELVTENMPGPTVSGDGTDYPTDLMGWFEVKEGYDEVTVYYDGVKVLTVFVDPKLDPTDTSSVIKVLSPENKTYIVTDVLLEYKVNRAFYTTTYSLDGQANITIIGNATLTGLSEGPHNIIVYIEDTPGNISSSDIIHFTVAVAPPTISVLSPENKTHNTADIPLTYTKDEAFYWVS